MWEDTEAGALKAGVPHELYWSDMTPKLLEKYVEAYEERLADIDRLNHYLGLYVAIGVNNPKRYPKKPRLSDDGDEVISFTTDAQRLAYVRQRYGGKA